MSGIRIVKPKSNFTQVHNAILRDSSVSWAAVGLFTWLNSHNESFELNKSFIINAKKGHGNGEAAIDRLIEELIEAGYVELRRLQITAEAREKIIKENRDVKEGEQKKVPRVGQFCGWEWILHNPPIAKTTEVVDSPNPGNSRFRESSQFGKTKDKVTPKNQITPKKNKTPPLAPQAKEEEGSNEGFENRNQDPTPQDVVDATRWAMSKSTSHMGPGLEHMIRMRWTGGNAGAAYREMDLETVARWRKAQLEAERGEREVDAIARHNSQEGVGIESLAGRRFLVKAKGVIVVGQKIGVKIGPDWIPTTKALKMIAEGDLEEIHDEDTL